MLEVRVPLSEKTLHEIGEAALKAMVAEIEVLDYVLPSTYHCL